MLSMSFERIVLASSRKIISALVTIRPSVSSVGSPDVL